MAGLKLVHRDLKLENVMVSETCEVRVLDFGLATDSLDGHCRGICGSPGYIAPEILRGFEYDTASDLFAVGVILYTLLSGELPFNGKTVEEKLRKNAKAQIVLSQRLFSSISEEAVDLIQSLITPTPDTRISVDDALSHPWL
jgi:serine/threonine protein kinase